jgi:hypothetical protein
MGLGVAKVSELMERMGQMPLNMSLLQPSDVALVLIDQQARLAFGAGSEDRQVLLNNSIALARTAKVFEIPIVASTSATKVYSGPLMPALHAAIPDVVPIERRNMNIWEDDRARSAVKATGRKRLLISGLLTEACVTFGVLSARGTLRPSTKLSCRRRCRNGRRSAPSVVTALGEISMVPETRYSIPSLPCPVAAQTPVGSMATTTQLPGRQSCRLPI